MENDSYITLSESCSAEIKIQRSKFIANAYPVTTAEESHSILEKIRKEYFDARHHPYAYVLYGRDNFRYNDDGEPAGSSGKPVYDAINKYNLQNVIVVVTRYFGGVKLGVGGLKRAYFEAADGCLKNAKVKEVILKEKYVLKFDYSYISAVMKYLETNKIHIAENNSSEIVELVCEVRLRDAEKFREELFDITNGKILINYKT